MCTHTITYSTNIWRKKLRVRTESALDLRSKFKLNLSNETFDFFHHQTTTNTRKHSKTLQFVSA